MIDIPNWKDFQHADVIKRGHAPAWIKTFTRLLSDDNYLDLTPPQRALLHGIWLEYARSGGKVTEDTAKLSRRLSLRVTKQMLAALNHAGFIEIRPDTVTPLTRLEEKREEEINPKAVVTALPRGRFEAPANSLGLENGLLREMP